MYCFNILLFILISHIFLFLEVGHLNDLPGTPVDDYENNEEFLKKAHHVLLEVIYFNYFTSFNNSNFYNSFCTQVEVMNGELVCPETGRKFPVTDGIPNMLANEDEV